MWSLVRGLFLVGFGVLGLLAVLLIGAGPTIDAKLEAAHARVENREPCFTCAEPFPEQAARPEPFLMARGWSALLGGAALLCGFGAAAAHEKLSKVRRDGVVNEASS